MYAHVDEDPIYRTIQGKSQACLVKRRSRCSSVVTVLFSWGGKHAILGTEAVDEMVARKSM
jgi:hypothetical protein